MKTGKTGSAHEWALIEFYADRLLEAGFEGVVDAATDAFFAAVKNEHVPFYRRDIIENAEDKLLEKGKLKL